MISSISKHNKTQPDDFRLRSIRVSKIDSRTAQP